MISMMLTILIVTVLLVLLLYRNMKRPHNYPPGPPRYPIVGNMFQFDANFAGKTLNKWRKQYGKIYSIKFGIEEVIVVSDAQAIKKAFSGNDFLDRPKTFSFLSFTNYQNAGISTSWGPTWQEHRRFTMKHLKDFGLGKSRTEDLIITEITEVIKTLKQYDGKEVQLTWDLNAAITNIIWGITAGERVEQDSPKVHKILKLIQDFFKFFGDLITVDAFPWLTYILPRKFLPVEKAEDMIATMLKFFEEEVDKHKLTFNFNEEDKDLIDSYLRRFKEKGDKPGFDKELEEFNLLVILADLFSAGGETTYTTTRWVFLYLLRYPEMRKRIQRNIDEVVGRNRMPCLSDRTSLTFVDALIMETQRHAAVVPTGVPHRNTVDTTVLGYTIPKGTQLIPLLSAVLMDPEVWGDPEVFRPERFLDSDGKLVKHDSFIPFSTGRRVCPGESLARAQLFLIVTCLLQQFDFESLTGNPADVSMETDNEAIVRYPKPYKMKIKTRKM